MSVFQPTVVRNHRKTKVKTWSIRYDDGNGKRVQENGFKTRAEASIRERYAKQEVKEERAGIRTPRIKQNEKPLERVIDLSTVRSSCYANEHDTEVDVSE